jgi:hypothetical protein
MRRSSRIRSSVTSKSDVGTSYSGISTGLELQHIEGRVTLKHVTRQILALR